MEITFLDGEVLVGSQSSVINRTAPVSSSLPQIHRATI